MSSATSGSQRLWTCTRRAGVFALIAFLGVMVVALVAQRSLTALRGAESGTNGFWRAVGVSALWGLAAGAVTFVIAEVACINAVPPTPPQPTTGVATARVPSVQQPTAIDRWLREGGDPQKPNVAAAVVAAAAVPAAAAALRAPAPYVPPLTKPPSAAQATGDADLAALLS